MLKARERQIQLVTAALDTGLAAVLFFALLQQGGMQDADPAARIATPTALALGLCVGVGWCLIMERFGIYESQRRWSMGERLRRLLGASALGGLILSTLAFALDAPVDRIFPLLLAVALFAALAGVRIATYSLLSAVRRAGSNYRNVLIVGAGPLARAAQDRILDHPEWGQRIVAFLDDGESNFVPAVPIDKIHKFLDVSMLLRRENVDEVLVACPRAMIGALAPVVRECALIGVPVTLLSDLFGDVLPPPRVGRFDSLSTLRFAPVHHSELALALKRAFDITGAFAGLCLSLPVIAVAALAIRLSSDGPVFFRQLRCGRNGRQFEMLKLRTMVADAEHRRADLLELNEMDGPVFKIGNDPRVTRVGRWLRRCSIDELPQLWNVLKGEMSLVGPRPPTPGEVVEYQGSDRRRLSMRPGLTCLWQISGRNEVSFEEWMRLDLDYIDGWSLARDLRIVLATIPSVISGRGAS